MILGVPFYLFGYKRGCWVTAIDPRLQNLEFGYSYLAATADCIHKCVIFHFSKKAAKTCCIWRQNELQPLYDLRR